MNDSMLLDRETMKALGARLREGYGQAQPFSHVVIDDFLPPDVLDEVLAEFPTKEQIDWWTFDDERERKLGTLDDSTMGPTTRHVFHFLNSATTIDFLTELTGIDGLVPDPHLFGGGLHQIEPGGFLKLHADFNIHPRTRLERRLNLLLYLNKGWKPEYGGALELWNADMQTCGQSIEPIFNRCVIFTTSDQSFHGHPDPLACPEGTTRKSMALYYYSAPRPTGAHNTVFRSRPGEEVSAAAQATPTSTQRPWRAAARRWLPPAVQDGIRSRRRGRG